MAWNPVVPKGAATRKSSTCIKSAPKQLWSADIPSRYRVSTIPVVEILFNCRVSTYILTIPAGRGLCPSIIHSPQTTRRSIWKLKIPSKVDAFKIYIWTIICSEKSPCAIFCCPCLKVHRGHRRFGEQADEGWDWQPPSWANKHQPKVNTQRSFLKWFAIEHRILINHWLLNILLCWQVMVGDNREQMVEVFLEGSAVGDLEHLTNWRHCWSSYDMRIRSRWNEGHDAVMMLSSSWLFSLTATCLFKNEATQKSTEKC